ncbi:ATP-binding protein [Streptomyces sp. NPDC058739]|uniref:ATP-binding protein n=1 Tax=Streptomyces sp. NPDC058739 TaxID=3346618 RepID=UPI0036B77861
MGASGTSGRRDLPVGGVKLAADSSSDGVACCVVRGRNRGTVLSVGVVLSSLRRQKGWTQEELAEESGVSVRTIRNLESGRVSNPRQASVELLFLALEADFGRHAIPAVAQYGGEGGEWFGVRPPINAFVGRSGEMTHLAGTVMKDRITVLAGPGGVGKTRLALEVAQMLQSRLVGDVFVLELGKLPAEERQPLPGVEPTLGLVDEMTGGKLLEGLANPAAGHESPGRQTLVVLDNAEHVPHTAATLAEYLVQEHPRVRVLITSRRTVPAPSAQVHDVTALGSGEALELMLGRVRSKCPHLNLSPDLEAVRDLCRRLEGMPRAIEFAAEKLRAIPVGRLLTDMFTSQVLASSPPDALPHQRSLSSSVHWSVGLLEDRNRDMLKVLARMPHSFTIEDAEVALPRGEFTSSEIYDRLGELVESSLVHVRHGRQYTYQVLSQVRAFVL